MPKKNDSALRGRAVRLVREHRSEYPSLTAASAAVARRVGVGHESVRRWVLQADIDDGTRGGVTSVESICRVLREQGCQIAARTYRAWRGGGGVREVAAARAGMPGTG